MPEYKWALGNGDIVSADYNRTDDSLSNEQVLEELQSAFQQFGHGVFAPHQGGILLRRGLVCLGLGGLLGHAFFIFHLQCGYSLKRLGKALCGGVWQPFCRVWQPAQLSGMIR